MSKQKNLIEASQNVTFDTSGNVGIGTSSPSAKLTLSDEGSSLFSPNAYIAGATADVMRLGFDSGGARTNIVSGRDSGTSGATNGYMAFETRQSGGGMGEAMRIDSAGRVTMPYQPAFKAYPTANTNSGLVVTTWATSSYDGFDTGGNISSDRFTAPVSGKYMFSINSIYNHGGDGNWVRIWTDVNGSAVVDGLGTNVGTTTAVLYQLISYSVVLNLSASDYVQIRTDDSGPNGYLYSNNYCRWSGYLIG